MKILAINLGTPAPNPAKPGVGMTGHFKQPVAGPVMVNALGLTGDTICDLKHHGGVDQAVYLFGAPDLDWWATQIGHDLYPGFFGENLLLSDVHSAELCLGDILTVGTVTLQVTSPRIPCATYQAHVGHKHAIRDFLAAGRPGAYARVLTEGTMATGDPVTLIPWAGERISVAAVLADYTRGKPDPAFLQRVLTVPAHHKMLTDAKAILAR